MHTPTYTAADLIFVRFFHYTLASFPVHSLHGTAVRISCEKGKPWSRKALSQKLYVALVLRKLTF